MKKKGFIILICLLYCLPLTASDIDSLSQVFQLSRGLLDRDGDSLAETIALRIIIPDLPTVEELAIASDIAARANLESLIIDFELVQRESDMLTKENPKDIYILIGTNLNLIKTLGLSAKLNLENLNSHQGLISLYPQNGRNYIILAAGSEDTLLKTGRAFFLRWPYLWDIWGREEGDTYKTVEENLKEFLDEIGSDFKDISIQSVAYEFPSLSSPHDAIKRLRFNTGEIKNLSVRIDFSNRVHMENARNAFEALQQSHRRGNRTDVLNYSACSQISIQMKSEKSYSDVTIRRIGLPKRILTPSYKSPIRPSRSGKSFDLLNLFSIQGVFLDRDKDSHADGLDTRLIISHSQNNPGIDQLASRLVLDTTGASFPIVQLDTEIENPKTLISPILIGNDNLFSMELLKTAKLKIPHLEKAWGAVTVVPEALNKSSALVITSADSEGMEKTLSYLSRTFPYLEEFKDGEIRIHDVFAQLEKFLKGENGTAEAYFSMQLKTTLEEIKDKIFESVELELYLPQKNTRFEKALQDNLQKTLRTEKFQLKSFALKDSKIIFEKQKDFAWEKDEALKIIQEAIGQLIKTKQPIPVRISVGISESPEIRKRFKDEIEDLLFSKGVQNMEVEVLSSYKQGFFWLSEKIVPFLKDKNVDHLLIRFAEENDDFNQLKRFYSDPYRWLQELYPVDEIIARDTNLTIEKIEFEIKNQSSPVYEALAFDSNNRILLQETFSPRTREDFYLKVLPEWGNVKLTTGWVTVQQGSRTILDTSLKTDMERFWDFYQDEVLPEVYSYILKKTGNKPTFTKQPYFKKLLFELWLSEPDYRLGLDEEIISSLESIHDELYFDTLDFIRGITEIELEDESLAEDSSRYSAPGNILPLIHPSTEGQHGRVKVTFEDWQSRSPQLILKWKEKNKIEYTKKFVFPNLKTEKPKVSTFVFNGTDKCIEQLYFELNFKKETEYTSLINIIEEHRKLKEQGVLETPFIFPCLKSLILSLKFEDLVKEEMFPVFPGEMGSAITPPDNEPSTPITPTDEIISPQECLNIVNKLGRLDKIQSYIAGISFENRKIPVLEIFSPIGKYISLPRLITFKPTLYLSGRQHANEVSATNYILKFAELLATDDRYLEYTKKVNFILHPMENPDGAALAYSLQKLTPFHSLHAGRYTSLGIDVSNQVGSSKPLLPEAKVRGTLYNKWLPDIYLNLHGYPSHEWVQQFSNYSPYLFRDYWIPRGWFAYYRSLNLPIYQKWKLAGKELKDSIIRDMTSNPKIKASNTKFYDRYFRWAARWQPHMNYLEREEGLNIYAKRRSSRASRLSNRRKLTFVEETPELMDETARGPWLDFLVTQGLTYLFTHVEYLSQADYKIVRIEEEIQGRVSIQFVRDRPGETKKK